MKESTTKFKKVKLGDIIENSNETVKSPLKNGIKYYIGLEHLDPDTIRIKRKGDLSNNKVTFTKRFLPGQVLFGKRRVYQHKSAIADFEGICSSDILVLKEKEENLYPKLLPFVLSHKELFDYAESTSSGSLSPRTKWKDLSKFEILLPPLKEQESISKVLWEIEKHIEKAEELIILTENLKRGLLNEFIFDSNTRGKGFKDVSLDEKTYFEILASGIDSFEGKKEYLSTESIQQAEITKIECEITYNERPSRANMQPIENSVWFARMKNTIKYICFSQKDSDRVAKYILSTGFLGLRCTNLVLPEYLNLIISSDWFQNLKNSLCQGGVQPAISNEQAKKILIPIPIIDKQKEIVAIHELISKQITLLKNHLSISNKLKRSIIDNLLSGKILFKE